MCTELGTRAAGLAQHPCSDEASGNDGARGQTRLFPVGMKGGDAGQRHRLRHRGKRHRSRPAPYGERWQEKAPAGTEAFFAVMGGRSVVRCRVTTVQPAMGSSTSTLLLADAIGTGVWDGPERLVKESPRHPCAPVPTGWSRNRNRDSCKQKRSTGLEIEPDRRKATEPVLAA